METIAIKCESKEQAEEIIKTLEKMMEKLGPTRDNLKAVFEKSFPRDFLDAMKIIVDGPEPLLQLPLEEMLGKFESACTTIAAYRDSMNNLQ